MDGILLFDKPTGWTSHDAVDFIRKRAGQRAVGHAGTLDPMATGLLVMLLGKATKRSQEFSGLDKAYVGKMTLGITTDTLDKEGRVLSQADVSGISEEKIREVFRAFTGVLTQIPPAYSAIKVGGKKLYDLARAGENVQVPPRTVQVNRFDLKEWASPVISFEVECSKGTYVRSLCDDAGKKLGCGAMLSELVRTRIGEMKLANAVRQIDLAILNTSELEKRLIRI